MSQDPNCIFCKIVADEIPSLKVYEDDQFVDSQLQAAIDYLLGNPILEEQDLSGN